MRRLIEERIHLEQAVAELEQEDRRFQSQIAARIPFRWEQLDQRLISPKTNELAEEMHKKAAEAERQIDFETARSGNSAGYLTRLFDFHERLADEWVHKLYMAHCEAWTQQNRTVTGEFIRAVWGRAISHSIAARKSSVGSQARRRSQRIGEPLNSVALGEWHRRMDRLATRWRNRLEAEAVASGYRAARENDVNNRQVDADLTTSGSPRVVRQRPTAQGRQVLDPEVWRSFHDKFKVLADEELAGAPHNAGDRWLRAYVSYDGEGGECGLWHVSAGLNEGFRARFEVEATRAGLALGPSPSTKPLDRWLHHVFWDLSERKSNLLFAANDDGGIIVRVCEASSTYCARLEKEALESQGEKQQEVSPKRPEPASSFSKQSTIKRLGRAPTRTSEFVVFAGNLWRNALGRNSQTKVSNEELSQIGAKLDERGYIPPAKFLEASYANELKAFNSRNSNSRSGAIKTWSQLVSFADKDHLRGMRKLLSRCAKNQPLP
jgi:hypothetical protein